MTLLKRLIREVHHRSLWQVTGIYLVGSWGALEAVDGVTKNAGLPAWVPPFALVLLVIGLPIVLATAFIQVGMPRRGGDGEDGEDREEGGGSVRERPVARRPGEVPPRLVVAPGSPPAVSDFPPVHGIFTWRNAFMGGLLAFSLLGMAVAGYFAMRITGVGPVASLAAQGVFEDREPVVLADFIATGSDPGIARLVTEALRVDLVESTALAVLPESYVSAALHRMGLPDSSTVTAEIAREIAQRDGFKAILWGEVGALGGGYVLTASLVEAPSGQNLGAFRETAVNEESLLRAIDKLSERIREKAGESLRQIRARTSLESVTTSSLEALKAYTEAMALSTRGREGEAIALLESALELDPDFGMAWRKLAVLLANTGTNPDRREEAATRAYELRSRMTEQERFLAEAYYFTLVDPQPQRVTQAYERVLAVSPDDPTALNNLATRIRREDPDRAIQLLEMAVNGPGASSSAHTNLVIYYWDAHRDEDAAEIIRLAVERYPGSQRAKALAWDLESLRGRFASSHDGRRELLGTSGLSVTVRRMQELQLASDDAGMGRLQEARGHILTVLDMAEAEEQPRWAAMALSDWAFVEVLMGSPESARENLRQLAALGVPWELDDQGWVAANEVVSKALLGDPSGAEGALARWEAAVPSPQRTDGVRGAMAWARWGVALGNEDAFQALEAVDYIQSQVARCGEGRCWGWWERARALEAAGRADEARAMYRRHLSGVTFTEVRWNPVMTPDALLRLGALAEEAGDLAEARDAYGRFVELWAGADPALQYRVQRAREALERLGG
jgi:eukaryotic-like serine/threonine-protein kinase